MPFVHTPSGIEADAATAVDYPRDLIGYGRNPPHARWPGRARIALQFVLNYEEGAENSILHGDAASETFLSEIIVAQAFEARHLSIESMSPDSAPSQYENLSSPGRSACAAG